MKRRIIRLVALALVVCTMMLQVAPVQASAKSLVEELLGFTAYQFHWIGENGREVENFDYTWGSADEDEKGFWLSKYGFNQINIKIDPTKSELYQKCKPALMWVHKADSLFDSTKYTDIDLWYSNKLEETFIIYNIPDYNQIIDVTVQVPIMFTTLKGLINGGYYEIEFYSEDAIPEQLMYAYEAQTYTLEELEAYIGGDMADSIEEYYNADSGFRSDVDGFPYQNTDKDTGGGRCAGMSSLSTAIYNGYTLPTSYKDGDNKFEVDSTYTWYNSIYGNGTAHDLVLEDNEIIEHLSPSYNMIDDSTARAYPWEAFDTVMSNNDEAFYGLLSWAQLKNNTTAALRGNTYAFGIKLQNLSNRWSIIDYIASNFRQGKAITVNVTTPHNGGHAVVGYRLEKIDEDTYRMYCYDNNNPDDMGKYYDKGHRGDESLAEDGAYNYVKWHDQEVYIDFTKKTITGYKNAFQQAEYDVFEFDSTHTSIPTTSNDGGMICFTLFKGDSVGVFNYGSQANEIVSYKAFPVVEDEKTVRIRMFAFYKSGEVIEITNSKNANLKVDYNFLGWYKIKDGKIQLTKRGYSFADSGTQYIECFVSYDNGQNVSSSVKVRIPVTS